MNQLTSEAYYKLYCNYYNNKINKLKGELEVVINNRNTIINHLTKASTSIIDVTKLKQCSDRDQLSITGKDKKLLDVLIKDLIVVNKTYFKLAKKYVAIKNIIVPYKVFKDILKAYNKTRMEILITKGIAFNLGIARLSIGTKEVPIKRNKETGEIIPRVNWPASFKLKEELEKEGASLYDKDTNPTGTKWLVYYEDERLPYFIMSMRKTMSVKNSYRMHFKPTVGSNGNVTKLFKYVKSNPAVLALYQKL